ncbi:MAG: hypothetical protein DI570_16220 [Phenylobacterium zucineum]|nr:MAG: hypothetical protein DI570_16220 [Phenylobacterium zucineum]
MSGLVIGKDLLLELIEATRGPLDSLDTMLLVTIVQANIAPLMTNPALEASYAALDQAPPDELRRPISVAAVAGATGLPFETVRRRVARLRDMGVCQIHAEGVVAPQQHLDTPQHRAIIAENFRILRDTYRRLEAVGFFEEQTWPATTWTPDLPLPMRASTRHSADYALRMVDLLRQRSGDVVNGLILLQLGRENTRRLGDARERFETPDHPAFAPDMLKEPVGASHLAHCLRLDRETVRRRLAAMVEAGLCERQGDGYIVPLRRMIVPAMVEVMTANDANLRRLYRNLARVGALQVWRADDQAAA